MLTELAYYFFIFAIAVFGLVSLILAPSLWGKTSAVAVRLGVRGLYLGSALLTGAFCLILYAFYVKDFSLAVVFETSSENMRAFFIPAALLSSREGLFYVFILILCGTFILAYRQKPHAYAERGKFLFSFAAILFLLLLLNAFTASLFVRIVDPPLEGVSLSPMWTVPYLSLKTLLSLIAFAVLIVSFVKGVCLYAKDFGFASETFSGVVFAAGLMLFSLFMGTGVGFLELDLPSVVSWEASETLLAGAFLLTLAYALCLYASIQTRTFSLWALFFGAVACLVAFGVFFAREYGLFSLKLNKAYFPNPVTAICAVLTAGSLLMFLICSFCKKKLKENAFNVLSKETFLGFAAISCAILGTELALFSFFPVLMLFRSDILWSKFPVYFKTHTLVFSYLFAVFMAAAFSFSFTHGKIKKIRKKLIAVWAVVLTIVYAVCFFVFGAKAGFVVLYSFPAALILLAFLNALNFKIAPVPQSFEQMYDRLKKIRIRSYGMFLSLFGFFLFSFSFSVAQIGKTQQVLTLTQKAPVLIENTSFVLEENEKSPRLTVRILDAESQKPRKMRIFGEALGDKDDRLVLHGFFNDFHNIVLIKIRQADDGEQTCFYTAYPFLKGAGTGFLLMFGGVVLLYAHIKRKTSS